MYGFKKAKFIRVAEAIWQIDKCENLFIEFYECTDCELQEKKLLK